MSTSKTRAATPLPPYYGPKVVVRIYDGKFSFAIVSRGHTSGETKTMASTQFEAVDARRCFPCWDEPAMKATFSCTLIVDQGLTALSNMPETCSSLLASGKRRVSFATTPKMSTYLLAFVVGEFDCLQLYTANKVSTRWNEMP